MSSMYVDADVALESLAGIEGYEFLSDLDIGFEEELKSLGVDPSAPTAAKPGSEEKVMMLAARYAVAKALQSLLVGGRDSGSDLAHRARQLCGAPGRLGVAGASRDGRSIHHRERRVDRLDEQHGGVGAHAEERRGAEVHVAGVTAEDVPRGGEHDEGEDGVRGEEPMQ